MRIVHVVTRSHRRGAEIVAIELADELDALGHHNQVVALVQAFDGGVEERLPPLVESKSVNARTMLQSGWRLRRMLDTWPADVVIAHGGWAAQVAAIGLRRRHGRRVWQRILGIPDRAWHGARRIYWRFIARRFDAAVVISSELEDEMNRLGYTNPVWRIPNARNPARFNAVDRETAAKQLRTELDLGDNDFVVAFVGHLVRQKQPAVAVDVVASMLENGCPVHLLIAGDGPLRASVEQRVAQRGISSSVTLLGHRDDLESIYGGADVVMITSESEGVPGVAIEAQMTGCPVITFAVGSVTDVIEHDVTGVVVEKPDVDVMARAAAELLADVPTRRVMSTAAREHSAAYSTARTAVTYDECLRSVCQGRRA
jgi:glycosyltransferase involved in cell wall biosynthesis